MCISDKSQMEMDKNEFKEVDWFQIKVKDTFWIMGGDIPTSSLQIHHFVSASKLWDKNY